VSLHAIPAEERAAPCESVSRAPDPRLLPYVVGYSAFRSRPGSAARHRILPLTATTVVIDITNGSGLVTGPRADFTVDASATWREGVAIGLTITGQNIRATGGLVV
jgi:hypothetical protein